MTHGGVSGDSRDSWEDTGSNPTWDGRVLHPDREGAPLPNLCGYNVVGRLCLRHVESQLPELASGSWNQNSRVAKQMILRCTARINIPVANMKVVDHLPASCGPSWREDPQR